MDKKIKLLVVDDEKIILDSIKKLLRKENIYEIFTAESVDEALKYFEVEEKPDLILTDLMMPEKDGLDFMRILNDMKYDGLIIMLTGYATINSALQAMDMGAFDYLAKPFTRDEIKRILNRARDVISAKKSKTEDEPEGKKYSEKSIIAEQSAAGKNTWFMTIEDGVLLIGVERPFLIEIGSIESVYLPRVGDEIRQGSNFFQIFSSDFRTFSVTAPFSGIIKEVNEAVINRPNQTLEDPYDTGWLIKMMPSKFEEELRSLSLKY